MIVSETILKSGVARAMGAGVRLFAKSAVITVGVVAGVAATGFALDVVLTKAQKRREKKAGEKAQAEAPAQGPAPEPTATAAAAAEAVSELHKSKAAVAETVFGDIPVETARALDDAMDRLQDAADVVHDVTKSVLDAGDRVVGVTGAVFDMAGDAIANAATGLRDMVSDEPGEKLSTEFSEDGKVVMTPDADKPPAPVQVDVVVNPPAADPAEVVQVNVTTHAAPAGNATESDIAKAVKEATADKAPVNADVDASAIAASAPATKPAAQNKPRRGAPAAGGDNKSAK